MMPKTVEIATIEAGGTIYRNWTTVQVTNEISELPLTFNFTASEKTSSGGTAFASMKLKPGDEVKITLAGHTVVSKGVVIGRQASYDSNQHMVQIAGRDIVGRILDSDVPLKGNQFKKSTFEQIAKKVVKPHGITVKMVNAGKDADKQFKDVAAIPGESVYEFLERLARMRNLRLWSEGDGTLNAGHAPGGDVADLIEGQNILAASCLIRNEAAADNIRAYGMNKGDDKVSDEEARKPAAEAKSSSFVDGKQNRVVVAEGVADADDIRIRADREASEIEGSIIELQVIVQGWLKPSGKLWKLGQDVTVMSPMLLLSQSVKLQVGQIVFSQDQSGTKTTLTIGRPGYFGTTGGGNDGLPGTLDPAKVLT